jgi:O-succinylbenzoate synthase
MTLTVARVTLREITLPLREPFRISSGVVHERRILLVRLEDADGAVAWGECVAGEAPNYSPETVDTCRHAIRTWLAPLLLGSPLADPAAVAPRFDAAVRGHRMAKAALEMPTWALAAARLHTSLATRIGGTRSRIDVGISLGIQPTPDALAAKAAAARATGYHRIKVKIAPGADLEYVAAARAALGPQVALSVDANAAYELRDAEHLARLDAHGLVMIEQPLEAEDLRRHAELQRRLATPICLDESITGPARAEDAIALGSARIVNIKPGRVGGFAAARAIHDVCAAHDVPVWCGGMLESGIGRAYNVALASLPNFSLPGDLSPSARYWERDIVQPEWTMDGDGTVVVPRDRPGIGVAVDEDRVDDLTVTREELVP